MDVDDETYRQDGICSRWGKEITKLDRWDTGTLHCSECGRSTVVADGARRHSIEVQIDNGEPDVHSADRH